MNNQFLFTLPGTPGNLVVLSTLDNDYGSEHPLSYATWMAFAIPLMVLNTFLVWVVLQVILRISVGPDKTSKKEQAKIKEVISSRKNNLGPISMHEIQVIFLFVSLILLWFFQSPKFMTGWADAGVFNGMTDRDPPTPLKIASATPAMMIVALTFILPRELNLEKSSPALLDWQTGENVHTQI